MNQSIYSSVKEKIKDYLVALHIIKPEEKLSLEQRLLRNTNAAAEEWNRRMFDPIEREKLLQELEELKARAYKTAQKINPPADINSTTRYYGI